MFISHKSNTLLKVADTEWDCRRQSKGMSKPEYWAWEATITSGDPPVVTYPSEDFTILEITDEGVSTRLSELDSYVSDGVYNIKVYTSKRNAEEILDVKGKSFSPKQYKSSHFIGDDTARDKRILDKKWADIRTKRNRLLTESDWVVVKAKETHANASIPEDWVDYRTELRDITKQSDPDDITWPTKP